MRVGNNRHFLLSDHLGNTVITADSAAASGGAIGDYSESYSYNSGTGNLSVKAGTTLVYGTQASDCPEGR